MTVKRHPNASSFDEPTFTHDCDNCAFVGNMVLSSKGPQYDVYFCEYHSMPGTGTVLVRYDNESPDYCSTDLMCAMSFLCDCNESIVTQAIIRFFNPVKWEVRER
jgi:hypothetical protein